MTFDFYSGWMDCKDGRVKNFRGGNKPVERIEQKAGVAQGKRVQSSLDSLSLSVSSLSVSIRAFFCNAALGEKKIYPGG